jgi:hypothetical protein
MVMSHLFGLSGMFGDRPEVTIATDNAVYRGGDTIRATVRTVGQDDFEIQEARAELVCVNTYVYWHANRDGPRVQRTARDEQIVQSARLLDAGVVPAGSADEHAVTFPLSTAAPATGEGAISAITWAVRAVLNVRFLPDVRAETPVTVLAPRAAYAWHAESSARSDSADCELAFDLPSRSLLAGETIDGALVVIPRATADVVADAIQVELVRREEVPRETWDDGFTRVDVSGRRASPRGAGNEHEEVIAAEVIATEVQLSAGTERPFPFRLVVPPNVYPTTRTDNTEVSWLLRGAIRRRLRPDDHLLLDVSVYNAP